MSKRTHDTIQAAPLRLTNHRDPQRLVCVMFALAREIEKTFPTNGCAEMLEIAPRPPQQVKGNGQGVVA